MRGTYSPYTRVEGMTTLRSKLIRLASVSNPERRRVLLSVLASTREAMEHATPEAMAKYLKEHPGADKSNHSVVKSEGGKAKGDGEKDKSSDKNPFHNPEVSKRTKATLAHAEKASGALSRLADQAKRLTSYRHSDPKKAKEVATKAVGTFGGLLSKGIQLKEDMQATLSSSSGAWSKEHDKTHEYYTDDLVDLQDEIAKHVKTYKAMKAEVGDSDGTYADNHVAKLAEAGAELANRIKNLSSVVNLTQHESWDKAYNG